MAKLTLNNLSRVETNQSIIDNLQRKGWLLVVDPIEPEYDPLFQKLAFNSEANEYVVVDLSEEELQKRNEIQAKVNADLIASEKLQRIREQTSTGYLVNPEGFTLGLSDLDRNAFTQMLTLVKEALSLGVITNDSNQIISDNSGSKHTISTLRFRQIMLGYGMYYKGLWDQLD